MAVVYQTYYGKSGRILMDHEFEEAVRRATRQRLWVVCGENRQDLIRRFTAAGGQIALRHHVSGLDVLLFVPADDSAGGQGSRDP
jgi:hypothetical protein